MLAHQLSEKGKPWTCRITPEQNGTTNCTIDDAARLSYGGGRDCIAPWRWTRGGRPAQRYCGGWTLGTTSLPARLFLIDKL